MTDSRETCQHLTALPREEPSTFRWPLNGERGVLPFADDDVVINGEGAADEYWGLLNGLACWLTDLHGLGFLSREPLIARGLLGEATSSIIGPPNITCEGGEDDNNRSSRRVGLRT